MGTLRGWLIATFALLTTGCGSLEGLGGSAAVDHLDAEISMSGHGEVGLVALEGAVMQVDDSSRETLALPNRGTTLGLASRIQALQGDCEDGMTWACDVLFAISPLGSDPEIVAMNCAGTGDSTDGFCTEGLQPDAQGPTGEITLSQNSPAIQQIQRACVEGEMTACDLLYFRSREGTRTEQLGNSCGDRVEIGLPDCRTQFGVTTSTPSGSAGR